VTLYITVLVVVDMFQSIALILVQLHIPTDFDVLRYSLVYNETDLIRTLTQTSYD
jgi:hypothetical protein